MDYYAMTDNGVASEIGKRIRSLRLRKNLTQDQLSKAAALSLNSIKALESGKGKLQTIIAVLRELGALDQLENFIPETVVSPLQLAARHGKRRVRASGTKGKNGRKKDPEEDSEW